MKETGEEPEIPKKKKGVTRVLFAIPRAGITPVEAIDNQLDMAKYFGKLEIGGKFEFYFATIGRIFVAKAREEFCDYAVRLDCDYLFMVDDDMICPPDLFYKLYAHNVDVIAPLAFQRRAPYLPVIYLQKEGWDEVRKEKYFSNETVKNYPKDKLFQCDAVGFGSVLIKVEVLKKMNKPRMMSTSPSGEDILFCYNARKEVGAKIFVDTGIKLEHLGAPIIIGEPLYEEYNNTEEGRKYHGECEKVYK